MHIGFLNLMDLQRGRVSTPFVVLVTVICCAVAFFLVSIYWQSYSGKRQIDAINEAEMMQVRGEGGQSSRASAPPIDNVSRYNPDRNSQLKKAIEILRVAVVNQDEAAFTKELSPLLALVEPYDEQRLGQNRTSSDIALTTWYDLRNLLPLAFAHQATFAVDMLLAQKIQCDPASSVGQNIIRAVAKHGDVAALEYYLKSSCARHTVETFAELVKHLPTQVLPQALPVFSKVFLEPMPLNKVNALLDYFYYKNQIEAVSQLVSFPAITEAMRSSEMNNLAVRALAQGKFDLARLIVESNAIHPKVRKSVVQSLIENALAGEVKTEMLHELFQLRGEQLLTENELEVYFRAIIAKSSTTSDGRLVNFFLAKIENLEERSVLLQQVLVSAVRSNNLSAVKALLAAGVDPNLLFPGKTLISIAQSSGHAQSQVIIDELKAHGASENYLDMVRYQRNGETVSNCKLAATPAPKIDFDGEPYKAADQDCKALVFLCADQGYGMDACIKAVPACPSDFKDEYLAYRCAGLSVYETLSFVEK